MVSQNITPPIAKDVTFERPQIEEESILKAHQFDLIYAQSGYLYTIIPDAPWSGTSRQDMLGASHRLYYPAPSVFPDLSNDATHPGNTHSVSQPSYTPDYSRVMAHSGATSFYAPHGYAHD